VKGIRLTYALALAAGKDAANRQMRRDGRRTWNEDDYDLCWRVFDRLWPLEMEMEMTQ
jgi:hypothetical protein